ncbi:5'-nucleotidase, partial [Amylostereum chailletii]
DAGPLVFNAIRAVHPQTPILILGGHTHIRDCVQLDGRSMALESGRYMETVGWMSANLDEKNSTGNITFTRRYLDPNRVTYEYHTSQSNRTFDTRFGQGITQGLEEIAQRYDLSSVFGTAPQDYTLTRNPYPSNGSLLSLMGEQALPIALATNNSRASIPNLIIANSGVLRFDIYKGVFDRNDQYTVATHPNAFVYVANVTAYGGPFSAKITPPLQSMGELRKRGGGAVDSERESYARGEVETRYRRWLADMAARGTLARRDAANLTLGYVTNDSCPGVGDDTPHLALPHFDTPDFFGSSPPNVADDAPIDLVFTDFEQGQVLDVLNALQSERVFTAADVASYSPILIDAVVGVFAKEAWN